MLDDDIGVFEYHGFGLGEKLNQLYFTKNRSLVFSNYFNYTQDSLAVKRRNDNHSPGPVIKELVPSSHQRSERAQYTFTIVHSEAVVLVLW